MAKKSDREAMAAALGGMVSRPAPEPPTEPTPTAAPAQKAPEAPQTPRKARAKKTAPPKRTTKPKATRATPEAGEEGGAFRKTGIGYVKADGTAMVRTVVMVTEDERQRLKMMALEAGLSPSDYVRRALGFLDE
ncbi:MAG: hypothetical protein AAFQ43_00125 [Bacteroidota bacterium]